MNAFQMLTWGYGKGYEQMTERGRTSSYELTLVGGRSAPLKTFLISSAVVLMAVTTVVCSAQSVTSAHSGTLHHLEGDVSVDGTPVQSKAGRFFEIREQAIGAGNGSSTGGSRIGFASAGGGHLSPGGGAGGGHGGGHGR